MSNRDDAGLVPTYIAQCAECEALIACAVADVTDTRQMRDAIKHREQWERDGYKVSTVTVQDVRTWRGDAFRHAMGCSGDKRKRKVAKQADLLRAE